MDLDESGGQTSVLIVFFPGLIAEVKRHPVPALRPTLHFKRIFPFLSLPPFPHSVLKYYPISLGHPSKWSSLKMAKKHIDIRKGREMR